MRALGGGIAVVLAVGVGMLFAGPAQAGKISLRISPGEANLNQRTCFQGRVRNGNRRRVAGAKVLLGTAKDRSNRRGKVRLCDALEWPGVHTAQAFKGSRDDLARIRVRSGGATANGTWIPIEIRLLAYPDWGGGCPRAGGFQDTWGVGRGSCKGRAQAGPPGPFSGNDITVLWDQGSSLIDVKSYYSSNPGWYMKGDVPSRSSGLYTIREGYFRPYYVRGGTDPAKAGQPEGPLLINVTAHTSGGSHNGYTIHVAGSAWYQDTPQPGPAATASRPALPSSAGTR